MEKGKEALAALYNEAGEKERDPLRIHVRLKEVLKARGISQKQLAEMTNIRPAAISELANNLRTTINREHVERIAEVLGIERLDELIVFEHESELWNPGNRAEQQVYIDEGMTKE